MLASNVQQSALIACRREWLGLAIDARDGGCWAGRSSPPLAMVQGAWGVGLGVLGSRRLRGGRRLDCALRNLGVAPPGIMRADPALAGLALGGDHLPGSGTSVAAGGGGRRGNAGVYSGMCLLVSRVVGNRIADHLPGAPSGRGPG